MYVNTYIDMVKKNHRSQHFSKSENNYWSVCMPSIVYLVTLNYLAGVKHWKGAVFPFISGLIRMDMSSPGDGSGSSIQILSAWNVWECFSHSVDINILMMSKWHSGWWLIIHQKHCPPSVKCCWPSWHNVYCHEKYIYCQVSWPLSIKYLYSFQ